jgi:hypothetical protein
VKNGFHIAVRLRSDDTFVHVSFHVRIGGKIALYKLPGFVSGDI